MYLRNNVGSFTKFYNEVAKSCNILERKSVESEVSSLISSEEKGRNGSDCSFTNHAN